MNNYQEFKEFLSNLKQNNQKPTLLLHSCCGPCSSSVLERLYPYFDITIFYYNPNIYPESEFDKRVVYQKKIIEKLNMNVKVMVEKAPHDLYLEMIDGHGEDGEGSIRCYKCYEFRIKKLAEAANEYHFDYFTTVMSVSPYKNSDWINEIGYRFEKIGSAKFLYSNFKKEEGYKRSIVLSKEYNLYRQDYCGCEYSIKEHEERVLSKTTTLEKNK